MIFLKDINNKDKIYVSSDKNINLNSRSIKKNL